MILAQLAPRLQQRTNWVWGHFGPERRTWTAGLIVIGALCYGWGNHNYVASQNAIKDVSRQAVAAKKEVVVAKKAVEVLQKHDNCVTRQANVATVEAANASGDTSRIPACPPQPTVPALVKPSP